MIFHWHRWVEVWRDSHTVQIASGPNAGMWTSTCGSHACYGVAHELCHCGATRERHHWVPEPEEVR